MLRKIPLQSLHPKNLNRTLHTITAHLKQHQSPPRLEIPDHDIKHVFVLGGGSGGQVINKTSSAAQLTHLPTGIVVKSQATRSRSQNYKIARRILADKVDERLNGKESRVEVKRARESKRKSSADKKKRRKYRALEAEKDGGVGEDEAEVGEVEDEAEVGEDEVDISEDEGESDESLRSDEDESDGSLHSDKNAKVS